MRAPTTESLRATRAASHPRDSFSSVRAAADLNRVHYQALGDDRKINYEEAKVYLKQAEDALRDKNLLFARTVADKAERIAAQLSGRD